MQAAQTSPPTVLHPQGGDQPAAPVTDQTLVPAKFRVTRETPEHRCVGDPSPQRERGVQGRTTPSKSRPRTRSPCKHCWHRRRAHPTRGKSPSPDSSNQERQPSPRPEEGQGHQLRAPPGPQRGRVPRDSQPRATPTGLERKPNSYSWAETAQ